MRAEFAKGILIQVADLVLIFFKLSFEALLHISKKSIHLLFHAQQ